MKVTNIFIAGALSLMFTGCADEFNTDYQAAATDNAKLNELINQFDVLKSYAGGMQVGAEVASGDILAKKTSYSQVVTNFTEVTLRDAFVHSAVVGSTGAIDSTKSAAAVETVGKAGLSLFGPSLCSPSHTALAYASSLTQRYVPGQKVLKQVTLENFEGMALGTTIPGSDGVSTVVEDPDGVSGHCIHFTTAYNHPYISVTLPAGTTLGDLVSGEYDMRNSDSGWIVCGTVKIVTDAGTKEYDPGKASTFGCTSGVWGRGAIKIDFSKLDLPADMRACSSFKIGLGEIAGNTDYYIDNFSVSGYFFEPGHYEPLAPDVQKTNVAAAWTSYVMAMMKSYGDSIHTWIIADGAIAGEGSANMLKTSATDADPAKFYWNEYLGDNYVADIAKTARSIKSGIKLLYSDDGLESDAVKLDRFCAMVKQWNAAGAALDGVNAEVHLVYDATQLSAYKQNIHRMLQALVATGLPVRLSGLDMRMTLGSATSLNVSDLSTSQLQAMSDYYDDVIQDYMATVPPSQRYGISFSNYNGDAKSVVGLWKQNYNRQPIYVGVVNGMNSIATQWGNE